MHGVVGGWCACFAESIPGDCGCRCDRLGLVSLAYLWEGDQNELLRAMVMSGMEIILVKVASMGASS